MNMSFNSKLFYTKKSMHGPSSVKNSRDENPVKGFSRGPEPALTSNRGDES
jgi:hypothetical protein